MPKINDYANKFNWLYKTGFFIILALPILTFPPWFYPPDWGKAIVFRSILAIMLFVVLWQFLDKNNTANIFEIFKKNKIIWIALTVLFAIFLLASIFSVDPYFSFLASPYRGGGFVTFAFYFVFAALALALLRPSTWKTAWLVAIGAGIFVCAITIIQYYGLFNKIFVATPNRPGSTVGNPIFLGIYLLLLIFPTAVFAMTEKNKGLKIFYTLSALLFLFAIFITGSRSSFLGVTAGVLIFFLLYPKKFSAAKISLASFLIVIVAVVALVNIFPQITKVLPKNQIISSIVPRLSIQKAFEDERFQAWQIVIKEIKDKPVLGWGPENMASGFDKNFDSAVVQSLWWDRAHNVFLDIGAQTGILGILAYILLFAALFWQLAKANKKTDDHNKKIMIIGMEAVLTAYLVANFFSFDTFCTYLIFFFIIAYCAYLTGEYNLKDAGDSAGGQKKYAWKSVLKFIAFLFLIIFLWQYNFAPLQINKQINQIDFVSDGVNCVNSLIIFEKILPQHTFLDSYLRMEYITFLKDCAAKNPDKDLEYAKKGVELLKEAVKIQPLYTRYWLYLGSFTTVIAHNEQNAQAKKNLLKDAYFYFDKTETLSPRRAETLVERAKADMVAGDYQKMKSDAEKCIAINPDLGNCYWQKALAEIYLKNYTSANADIEMAHDKKFEASSIMATYDLIAAYAEAENYQELIRIYEKLVISGPNIPQYRSSLALALSKAGRYKEAREQAMVFLKLMPEAKDEVDAFLKTLPY